MNIPTQQPPTAREFPNSDRPFMRFQIGFWRDRPLRIPVFENKRSYNIVGFEAGGNVAVFHLCGYGSTMEKAEAMAGGMAS